MIDKRKMAEIRKHVEESEGIVYSGEYSWPSFREMHIRYLNDIGPLLNERDELTERVHDRGVLTYDDMIYERGELVGGRAYSPFPSERPAPDHIDHVYGNAVVHYEGPDGPRIAIHYRIDTGASVVWTDHHGSAESMRRMYPEFFRQEANEWPTNWDPWPDPDWDTPPKPERKNVKGPNRRWIIHRAINNPHKLKSLATWVGLKLGVMRRVRVNREERRVEED